MSSHHIVRDEQEPALLVAGNADYTETVGQLLEWSPVLAVAYPLLPKVIQWGCKIDAIICEPALSFQAEALMEMQIPYVIWNPHGKGSLLDCGLKSLAAAGHRAVNILGISPQSVQQQLLEDWSSKIDLVLYEEGKRWRLLPQGKYEKWLAQEVKLWLPTTAVFNKRENIEKGAVVGEWSVIADGMVSFELNEPSWIAEQIV